MPGMRLRFLSQQLQGNPEAEVAIDKPSSLKAARNAYDNALAAKR